MAIFHDRTTGSIHEIDSPDVTHLAVWTGAESGSVYQWPHSSVKQSRTVRKRVERLDTGETPTDIRVLRPSKKITSTEGLEEIVYPFGSKGSRTFKSPGDFTTKPPGPGKGTDYNVYGPAGNARVGARKTYYE